MSSPRYPGGISPAPLTVRARSRSRVALSFVLTATLILGTAQAQTPPSGGAPPGGGPGGGGATLTALTGFTIGNYTLQSSYRYSEYEYDYTFTTTATNSNSTPYSSVLGTVTSSSSTTVVRAGTVEFGGVAADSTAAGLTTFTIRQDRRYPFDPSSLTWTFEGASSSSTIGTTASSVSLKATGGPQRPGMGDDSLPPGTAVSLTATVSPTAGTGTVTFYDRSTALGTVSLSSGTAALSSYVLPSGKHELLAVYSGDTTYASSYSGKETVAIGPAFNCNGLKQTAQVVCLAREFEATLTSSQISTLQLDYTLANVEHWSNLPLGIIGRNGLQFSTLSSTQLTAALELAQTALSEQGYERLQHIRGADDILNAANSGMGWGSGNYFIAFYGTPSTTSPWMLQINGHHFALNHTYNGNDTSATPYFLGVEPTVYPVGTNLYMAMEAPRKAVYGLTQSVYGNSTALLSGTFDDVVMGVNGSTAIDTNYPQTYPTTGRGIPYSALTPQEQQQVREMIEAWVTDIDPSTAHTLLSVYEDPNALANTYVGYSGDGTLATQGDYLRVDGPRVWIEFCVQNGIAWPASYHYHTIWRDKTADYGGDFSSQ